MIARDFRAQCDVDKGETIGTLTLPCCAGLHAPTLAAVPRFRDTLQQVCVCASWGDPVRLTGR